MDAFDVFNGSTHWPLQAEVDLEAGETEQKFEILNLTFG